MVGMPAHWFTMPRCADICGLHVGNANVLKLVASRPDVVAELHNSFLAVGTDAHGTVTVLGLKGNLIEQLDLRLAQA